MNQVLKSHLVASLGGAMAAAIILVASIALEWGMSTLVCGLNPECRVDLLPLSVERILRRSMIIGILFVILGNLILAYQMLNRSKTRGIKLTEAYKIHLNTQ